MSLNPKWGKDTALCPRPANSVPVRVSILRRRGGTEDVFYFVGNFRWSGGEGLPQKHALARGMICSIKPKLEWRVNVFAHNTGLISLNQNAHICISTQDYFNPTCFLDTPQTFIEVLTYAFFFF